MEPKENNEQEQQQLPEAPISVTVKGYYKGYSVLVTKRDPDVDVKPLLASTSKMVDWMEANGWKNTWDEKPRTSGGGFTPRAKVDQATCPHDQGTENKVSAGFNKPENKGKIYEACSVCGKFIKWVSVNPQPKAEPTPDDF